MSDNEREQRYAEAIYDKAVDHPMWIGDDGKPLDYMPARETRMADFVYQAAAAVMAVADAERAERPCRSQRALADERTKVARVEQRMAQWGKRAARAESDHEEGDDAGRNYGAGYADALRDAAKDLRFDFRAAREPAESEATA